MKGEKKGENTKLHPKYVGLYESLETKRSHTYLIEWNDWNSWQIERQLKLYQLCGKPLGDNIVTGTKVKAHNEGATRKKARRQRVLDPAFEVI